MSGVSDTFDSKTVIQRTIHGERKSGCHMVHVTAAFCAVYKKIK